jgi:hypothetical protein
MASQSTKLKTLATRGPQRAAVPANARRATEGSNTNIWSVTVHIELPAADRYRIHPTAYERLQAILEGRGPIIKPERNKLVVVFGIRVDDLTAAQKEAGPLVAQLTDTLGLSPAAAICIRMISTKELDDELSKMPECAGVGEVAAILGVSKQRVHQLLQRPDFPKPVQQLAATPLWREADVRRYSATRPRRSRTSAASS